MAKRMATSVLDAPLDKIATGTLMIACSAEPTTRAEAVTTYALSDVAVAPGDFTKAAGTPSGRQTTVAAKNAVPVDTNGTATHVAIVDGTEVLAVTTCTAQALTAGNTLNFPAFKFTFPNPT